MKLVMVCAWPDGLGVVYFSYVGGCGDVAGGVGVRVGSGALL